MPESHQMWNVKKYGDAGVAKLPATNHHTPSGCFYKAKLSAQSGKS